MPMCAQPLCTGRAGRWKGPRFRITRRAGHQVGRQRRGAGAGVAVHEGHAVHGQGRRHRRVSVRQRRGQPRLQGGPPGRGLQGAAPRGGERPRGRDQPVGAPWRVRVRMRHCRQQGGCAPGVRGPLLRRRRRREGVALGRGRCACRTLGRSRALRVVGAGRRLLLHAVLGVR